MELKLDLRELLGDNKLRWNDTFVFEDEEIRVLRWLRKETGYVRYEDLISHATWLWRIILLKKVFRKPLYVQVRSGDLHEVPLNFEKMQDLPQTAGMIVSSGGDSSIGVTLDFETLFQLEETRVISRRAHHDAALRCALSALVEIVDCLHSGGIPVYWDITREQMSLVKLKFPRQIKAIV